MNTRTLFLTLISIFIFVSCGVNEPEYDNSIEEDGISLSVKNETNSLEGNFTIINKSKQTIYIPYIHYNYCNFIPYTIEELNNNLWIGLLFNNEQNLFVKADSINSIQDSIMTVCDEYRKPIIIKPNKSFTQNIFKTYKKGEYRLVIRFRNSEIYNPESPDKELIIKYKVSK